MRSRDLFFVLAIAGAVAALLSPVLAGPGLLLGNFGDIYAYHYPLRHLAAARLQAGELPFWNPYIFAGIPLLANSQAALFYPLSAFFQIFHLNHAFTLFAFAHLLLAGLGMHLLLRSRGLSPASSCCLALAFCLSPFVSFRLAQGIPTHLAALAYLPWCWLALESGKSWLLAGTLALQLLSGHPQFALIHWAAMAAYAVMDKRRLKTLCVGTAGAAALSLIQAVPTAEFLSLCNRKMVPAVFLRAYSMPPAALASLFWPGYSGDPLTGDFPDDPSVFFETCTAYVGLLPLVLALWALARSRREAAFGWLLAAAGVVLALGRFDLSPAGLSRVPARFLLLTFWGLFLAAACGAKLVDGKAKPAWRLAAILFVLGDLGMPASRYVYAEEPGPKLAADPVVAEALGGKLVRFASDPELANPNKAMLYRAMNVNGYDAAYLENYTRYVIRSEAPVPAVDPSRTHIRNVRSREMSRLGVGYTLSLTELGGAYRRTKAGGVIYPVPGARPLAFLEGSSEPLEVESPRAERWIVKGRASGSGLVLAVPSSPGWKARLNGRPVPIRVVDGLLMGIDVPAADAFTAEFTFVPSFWPGLCLFGAVAWSFWLWREARI
ncbi:MAG: hypothetical protein WC728_04680 [Elusimicrobiota bacterium]